MLDQNTDRMWYVIGAVIIGAAIILILNSTFPQLFASVGNTFKGKTEQVTEITDGIMPNTRVRYIKPEEVVIKQATLKNYDSATNTWTLVVPDSVPGANQAWLVNGLMIRGSNVLFKYGTTHVLSYDVFVPEGITNVSGLTDIVNSPVDASVTPWIGGQLNDLDDTVLRDYAGKKQPSGDTGLVPMPLKSGEWNTLTIRYSNSSKLNTGKHDLVDNSLMGIRNESGKAFDLKIRNITLRVQ